MTRLHSLIVGMIMMLFLSSNASAVPVIFDITLDTSTTDGSGTIIIDDSLIGPNAVVFTGDAVTSINLGGTIFNTPYSPSTEQFIFDALGQEIIAVNDTGGSYVDFEDSAGSFIFIELDEGSVPGTFVTLNFGGLSGTFDITRRGEVALPATYTLFALGLAALGYSRRRSN
ncbi:MAG: hypothetical protein ABW079_01590 [Sedimenticola sp.]